MLRSLSQVARGDSFEILPTRSDGPGYRRSSNQPSCKRFYTKRILRLVVFAVLCIGIVHLVWGSDNQSGLSQLPKLPPLYDNYQRAERNLPQHNPELPPPEGKRGKYIWFANHVHGSGWGNAMQEHLLNAHLAHESGRAFVFRNYTWNEDAREITDYLGHPIPSRIPISVYLRGPAAGGPWPPEDPAPRAVRKEYWDQVCPQQERHVMMSDELFTMEAQEDAGVVLQTWVEKLKTLPRCVEINELSTQIFNIWIFGSNRVLGIWNSLKTSPVLTQFRWSQLVENGFLANRHLFSETSWLPDLFTSAYPYTPIPGLLALHIRRGDFESHCLHFAKWSSPMNGFNQFPEMPDQFEPPAAAGRGEYTEEGKEIYLRHCFPDIKQIVGRVEQIRATPAGQGLKNIFIMTNAKKPWLQELKAALDEMGGWEKIVSSRDLELDWEQQYIAQAVDMLIGQRAQVIIGNGFSSLTSNIIMLRMAQDVPGEANRLW
ncbi:hypothetical protein C8Q74DRAFT_1241589 [Fomes fomentarius]|nr:hypothetical protein C8Q74DRAFT_1241589 [Fomes fomentarius]